MSEDRIGRLESAIVELGDRINALEQKLCSSASGPTSLAADIAVKTVPLDSNPARDAAIDPINFMPGGMRERPRGGAATKVSAAAKEHSPSGGKLLAACGMLFFILAASSLIRLAIESGWLTPARQLGGAALFGFALIGVGFRLRARDFAYATFLPAAGVVILFMTVFAGHGFYGIFSQESAIWLAALVTFFSLYIFSFFKHDFFLVTALVGTYFVPILLARFNSDPLAVRFYFIFWDLCFAVCAIHLQRRLVIALTAYAAIGVWQVIFAMTPWRGDIEISAIIFQATQFAILCCATVLYSVIRKTPLTAREAWAALPVLVIFYFTEYEMLYRFDPEHASISALGFAGAVCLLYIAAEVVLQRKSLESAPMVATFVALVIVHAFYFEILADTWAPWFAIGVAVLLALLPRVGFSFDKFWPAYFVMIIPVVAEYGRLILPAPQGREVEYALINFLFFALIMAGYLIKQAHDNSAVLIVLAEIQGLCGLAKLAKQLGGVNELYYQSGFWGALALGLLVFAQIQRNVAVARSAMVIFALVAAKVLLVDISGSGSLARVAALLIIGMLLYAGGFVWRQITVWDRSA